MFFKKFEGIPIERLPFCDFSKFDSVVFVFNEKSNAEYVYSIFQKTQKDFDLIFLDFFESDIYESTFSDYEIFLKRAESLTSILNSKRKIVITTFEALNYKVPRIEYFQESFSIERLKKLSMNFLIEKLIDFGYFRTEVVRNQGHFSIRGGIVDLFPPLSKHPIRIDFFGDEIDSIKTFDSKTQISNGTINSFVITKCSEIILNDNSKHLFRQKFKFKNDHIKESIEYGNFFPGIEWFQNCFHEETVGFLDYLSKNTKFVFDFELDKHNKIFFEKCEKQFEQGKNVLPVFDIFTNSISKIENNFEVLKVQPFGSNSIFQNHDERFNIRNEPDRNRLFPELFGKVVFSVRSNGALNILIDILKDQKINKIDSFFDAKVDEINLIISDLQTGFLSKNLNVYTEKELFGETLKFALKKKSKDIFKDYSKLSVGDYVVHEKQGIAIFEGLINIEVSGIARDFLHLKYKNDDKLYVPVENIALISRYGDGDSNVQLDLLKSNSWSNRKLNVRKKLLVIANDLLKLAAKRKMNKSIPFVIPENYGEFSRGFGHIETDDQFSAINDVLIDLTGEFPMDRLVCGDVGFGKTEVALRAAFVVSSSLRQVVLLAPTTILVSQHYKNFVKRFRGFGIEICQLSRFIPKKQLLENIQNIASGKVQIIIATHSILSEKIKFADLGLVIIDEEQHFGVKQKEFLKRFHENTHFMTLSATPIPRTLQLAMSGVKELSMITTPPTNRLPVKTLIYDFDKEPVINAIENEVKVGGQVFFVTPRVEFLDTIYNFAVKLFPNLKIQKAHGKSNNLEEILQDFCDCKIDVLVSTNIIDSGIDIPNANTILIHRFDLFGLSQLYQLRGRVGRSKRQAYAYLLLENNKVLTENAKKRLDVLNNLNKLGAGFNLASYDLDIRGAGNLLGEEQSGYIKEVGVELYQSMLKEAILMLKAGCDISQFDKKDVQINLGVPVLIPDHYIEDSSLRLEIYRKIGAIESEEAVNEMEYELSDRFGRIPFETKNLLTLIRIKINCLLANVAKLDVGFSGVTFSFFDNKCKNVQGLMNFLNSDVVAEDSGVSKIRSDQKIVIIKKWKDVISRTNNIYKIMKKLSENVS